MGLRVAIVVDAVLPVTGYGGTERVAYGLGKALSAMGHRVTFLCRDGSYVPFARVVAIDPTRSIASQLPVDIDIVHFNNTVDYRELEKPYIVTMHGNGPSYDNIDRNTVFVSANHAARYGCDSYVYNGLDWDDYGHPNLSLRRESLHFLGNGAWRVKNLKGAIDVAKRTGRRLDVLGAHRLNVKMGFRLTLSPSIRFHGMVNNAAKKYYIERSRGLVFPVTWHEPFGLCIIESLYYGAPVYGTPYGSIPELVTPSDSMAVGALSCSVTDMATAITESAFSPTVCHEYATDMFSANIMARNYIEKYHLVLDGHSLVNQSPMTAPPSPRHLPWDK